LVLSYPAFQIRDYSGFHLLRRRRFKGSVVIRQPVKPIAIHYLLFQEFSNYFLEEAAVLREQVPPAGHKKRAHEGIPSKRECVITEF
jgi:hypothetical protein